MSKRLIIIICISLLMVGCSKLGNTPTSKVENLLNKYQMLDDTINLGIEEVVADKTITSKQKKRFKKILERQYKNLTYEIKKEEIDKDMATVTVTIEVLNYKKALEELDKQLSSYNYSEEEYTNKKLTKLESVKEKVIYTIDFELLKTDDETWKVKDLTDIQKRKIQGMY